MAVDPGPGAIDAERAPRGFLAAVGEGVKAGLGWLRRWLSAAADHGPSSLHLRYHLTITAHEAATGTRKRVAFLRGAQVEELIVTIPPGIRSGTRLRLRGKGLERADGARGDLYLRVTVT